MPDCVVLRELSHWQISPHYWRKRSLVLGCGCGGYRCAQVR